MENEPGLPKFESPTKKSLLQRLTNDLGQIADKVKTDMLDKHPKEMLTLRLLDMRMRYPKEYKHLSQAAEIYSNYKPGDKLITPEITDPEIREDLNLIKDLEPLQLWQPGLNKNPDAESAIYRKLRALETLDYCYNPDRMSNRTGLPVFEIGYISEESRKGVATTCTSLQNIAYGVEPLNKQDVNPDSFSRPLIIFLTPDDIKTIYVKHKIVAGMANPKAKAAYVAVDPEQHLREKKTNIGALIEVVSEPLIRTGVHEFAHLLRLSQKDQLHYRHLNWGKQDRLARNLEEGTDELYTMEVCRQMWPKTDITWMQPRDYRESALRIQNDLVPALAKKFTTTVVNYEDLPVAAENGSLDTAKLTKVINARFLLGDYELLDRGTGYWLNERNLKSSIRKSLEQETTPWHEAQKLLEHPDIFGCEFIIFNDFYPAGSSWEEGSPWPERIAKTSKFLPIPVARYNDAGWTTLKPEYTYQVYEPETKTWEMVAASQIPFEMDTRVRVNHLEVNSDFT